MNISSFILASERILYMLANMISNDLYEYGGHMIIRSYVVVKELYII